MIELTTAERRIIEALAIYRFLTVEQMLRLRIGKHRDTCYKPAHGLSSGVRPLLRSFIMKPHPSKGRLPNVYSLTEHGADIAAELLMIPRSEVQFIWPTNHPNFAHYEHTTGLIDIHIAVRTWADANNHLVAMFDSRLNFTGGNRRKPGEPALAIKTKIPLTGQASLIPDSVFMLANRLGKPYLFCVEYQREPNTAKLINKIGAYCHAIGTYALHDKFKFTRERDPRVLIITDSASLAREAIKDMRCIDGFADYLPLFRFKTLCDFQGDVFGGWYGADVPEAVTAYSPATMPNE
jgi:hypothetical protein